MSRAAVLAGLGPRLRTGAALCARAGPASAPPLPPLLGRRRGQGAGLAASFGAALRPCPCEEPREEAVSCGAGKGAAGTPTGRGGKWAWGAVSGRACWGPSALGGSWPSRLGAGFRPLPSARPELSAQPDWSCKPAGENSLKSCGALDVSLSKTREVLGFLHGWEEGCSEESCFIFKVVQQ